MEWFVTTCYAVAKSPGNCSEFVVGFWSKERLLYGVESKAVGAGERQKWGAFEKIKSYKKKKNLWLSCVCVCVCIYDSICVTHFPPRLNTVLAIGNQLPTEEFKWIYPRVGLANFKSELVWYYNVCLIPSWEWESVLWFSFLDEEIRAQKDPVHLSHR